MRRIKPLIPIYPVRSAAANTIKASIEFRPGQDGIVMLHHLVQREGREGNQTEEWIENHNAQPHVTQRFGKDTWRLFFDELGRDGVSV